MGGLLLADMTVGGATLSTATFPKRPISGQSAVLEGAQLLPCQF